MLLTRIPTSERIGLHGDSMLRTVAHGSCFIWEPPIEFYWHECQQPDQDYSAFSEFGLKEK